MAFFLVCLILAVTTAAAEATEHQANPVRKVVTMLQAMQKKISAEAETEEKLFENFQCYCKGGGKNLGDSISGAETKMPAVSSDIEEAESQGEQLKQDLEQHKVDRNDAKAALASAKAQREKEAAAYSAETEEEESTIATIKSAVAALEKGMGGSFLQTAESQVLQRIVMSKQDLLESDRAQVLAFLSGEQSSPQSGEITGILKEMSSNMAKGVAEAKATEKAAVSTYTELVEAKKKELSSLTSSIETKTGRVGELAVSVVQMKNDLSETEASLIEDKKYLADLDGTCKAKAAEWEERKKVRSKNFWLWLTP